MVNMCPSRFTPYDEDYPCEVCGEYEDKCICPECPVCGDYGNPDCYLNHGMKRTEEQKFNAEVIMRDNIDQDDKMWRDINICQNYGISRISHENPAMDECLCDDCWNKFQGNDSDDFIGWRKSE